MRIRFTAIYQELTTNKAIIDRMLYTAGDRINLMSQDLREMASDYLEMYKKFKEKVVENGNEESAVYNGSIMNDWYSGKYGNKCQGLLALREFSRRIIKNINESVGATKKK